MQPFLEKTLKVLPFIHLGGLLVSTFVTYTVLQYRVDGLERRVEKASPETVVVELRTMRERLNEIRDDVKDVQRRQAKNEDRL